MATDYSPHVIDALARRPEEAIAALKAALAENQRLKQANELLARRLDELLAGHPAASGSIHRD